MVSVILTDLISTVNIAHCGRNYGNLLSQFFGKNFVKTTFLLIMDFISS